MWVFCHLFLLIILSTTILIFSFWKGIICFGSCFFFLSITLVSLFKHSIYPLTLLFQKNKQKPSLKVPLGKKKKKITKRDNEHIYLSNDNYFYILLIFYFIHLIHSQSDKSLKNKSEDINRLNNFQ